VQFSATLKDTDAVPPSFAPLIPLFQVIMSLPDLVQTAPPLVLVDVLVVPLVEVPVEVPPPPAPQLIVKGMNLSPPAMGVLCRTCTV